MPKILVTVVILVVVGLGSSFAGFVGINYGPFHRPGQGPGTRIEDEQFQKDLTQIWGGGYRHIRTYEVGEKTRMDKLVPYIKDNFPGMKVYLGIWISENNKETDDQVNTAIALANDERYKDIIECIVVGNEVELHKHLRRVVDLVREVKRRAPHVKATSCLTFGDAMDHGPTLLNESGADFLMLNVYPFFVTHPDTIPIEQAKENTRIYGYEAGKTKSGGKPVILGEVGWPSEGPANGKAIPSVANQKRYIAEVSAAANSGELGAIFIFEAFNEPWKTWKPVEPFFGVWNSDGSPK
ncbi:MAG TPA: glycosyl hydrolase family 17 protein [Terrimicrobiaceae bacterium]